MKTQFEHHSLAVEALAKQVEAEGIFDALIITGSVPRGTARPDSDIDCYVLVGDEEYDRRRNASDLAWMAECDYPGGYVDGKVISLAILEAAAERGSEPTRSSFAAAHLAFSRLGDLQPTIDRIGVYPEANRAANMRDFFAAAALHASYFGPQALSTGNAFLLSHATTMTVLYGARAVLAHNRILFPCPKQLLEALEQAPDQPDGFADNIDRLLAEPTEEGFATHLELLGTFTDWGLDGMDVLTRFMELDEWTWWSGTAELAQR